MTKHQALRWWKPWPVTAITDPTEDEAEPPIAEACALSPEEFPQYDHFYNGLPGVLRD
jgi:hypothetical protein